MDKETKKFILSIGILAVVIGGGYTALVAYTGFTLPFSSVVSESMQHDNDRSEIGIIDTGDIVVVKDPSNTDIQSYIEGLETGYESFGHYGSVIIYNRDSSKNPVIHRAIVWLDYNGNNTWSSEELADTELNWYYVYQDENNTVRTGTDPYNIQGTLFIENVYGKNPYINLNNLQLKKSGYLTMGDNPETNPNFDQSSGIIGYLISQDDIRSVPVLEIPWLGTLKLLINGSSNLDRVPNSLPSLIMEILLIFSILFIIDIISAYRYNIKMSKEMESVKKWSGRRF